MEGELEKIIEVKNVRKVYKMGSERINAVDDVSFEINKGEFCCLLGTSGSGKSTLLNLMAGIEKVTAGQIMIKGKNIPKMGERGLAKFRQRYLGFVFQSYNLMDSMTALENVEFPLIFKRVRVKVRKKLAKDMLEKVGLGARLKHKPKEMSGGQQQRVGIARAFVARPEIVFADEPTGNLDTKTAMEVMDLIRGIARDNNQTIVMVTHDPRLANYADKIIHILDGKIQSIEVKDIKGIKDVKEANEVNELNEVMEANENMIIKDLKDDKKEHQDKIEHQDNKENQDKKENQDNKENQGKKENQVNKENHDNNDNIYIGNNHECQEKEQKIENDIEIKANNLAGEGEQDETI